MTTSFVFVAFGSGPRKQARRRPSTSGEPIAIEVDFDVLEGGHVLVPNLHFFNEEGTYVFVASEVDSPWHRRARPVGLVPFIAWLAW